MCQIGLQLTTTVQEGLSVTSATGRYRLQGTSSWTTFNINLSNPLTPNITNVGLYELQVNVADSSGSVSPWSPSAPTIIEISTDCNPIEECNFDGSFYYYDLELCDSTTIIKVRSSRIYTIGTVVITDDSTVTGTIIAVDCTQNSNINIVSPSACISGNCVKFRITNNAITFGFTVPPYIDCADNADIDTNTGFGGQEIPFGQSLDICAQIGFDINFEIGNPGVTIQNLGACDI